MQKQCEHSHPFGVALAPSRPPRRAKWLIRKHSCFRGSRGRLSLGCLPLRGREGSPSLLPPMVSEQHWIEDFYRTKNSLFTLICRSDSLFWDLFWSFNYLIFPPVFLKKVGGWNDSIPLIYQGSITSFWPFFCVCRPLFPGVPAIAKHFRSTI